MKKRFRHLSREQFEELWRRWKQRETLAVIGAALARPKICRLRRHARLPPVVAAKLPADWSPEQIAPWLRRDLSAETTKAFVVSAERSRPTRVDPYDPVQSASSV